MEIFSTRRLTRIGVITALYVVTTLLCAPLAYNAVQFRVSEMLMLLCCYNKDYILSLSIGCFLSNLFSTLGTVDMLFGTAATVIAAVLMYLTRKKADLFVSSLFPVVSNALLVGLELKIVFGDPFWINAGYIAIGELVCISLLGVIVFKALEKNAGFMKLIAAETADTKKE
ncbi:MAG: QueT transporter family protein [Ruminococcus sp.]|nr:QueT transporter family protein [Ruminococcus sp.]